MLKYRLLQIQNTLTVTPEGDIVFFSYPDLERAIRARAHTGQEIVFDLQEMDFIDSSGIGFVLRMKKLAESTGGCFMVHNPSRLVARILRRLKLNDVLAVGTSHPAWKGNPSTETHSGSLCLATQAGPC